MYVPALATGVAAAEQATPAIQITTEWLAGFHAADSLFLSAGWTPWSVKA